MRMLLDELGRMMMVGRRTPQQYFGAGSRVDSAEICAQKFLFRDSELVKRGGWIGQRGGGGCGCGERYSGAEMVGDFLHGGSGLGGQERIQEERSRRCEVGGGDGGNVGEIGFGDAANGGVTKTTASLTAEVTERNLSRE